MRPEILNYLFSPLSIIKGVGEKKISDYTRLLVNSTKSLYEEKKPKIIDLLFYLPEKILERKFIDNLFNVEPGTLVVAKIKVLNHNEPTKKNFPYQINCILGTQIINIVYYKYYEQYLKNKFIEGRELVISGKFEKYMDQYQIVHPDYITNNINDIQKFEPIYSLTYNIYNKNIIDNINIILRNTPELPEWLDKEILLKHNWKSWKESLIKLHNPDLNYDLKDNRYIKRLAFDELLAERLALTLIKNKIIKNSQKSKLENSSRKLKSYFLENKLSFTLTSDQLKVIREIESDTFSTKVMQRLLQGDVGSGKTIVAFLSMLNYIENKKQCVLMVPTSILAMQHFDYISKICSNENITVEVLTGKIKGKKRENILERLKNGEIDILIGTHALLEENVEFKNLGFVVIDEQHRFGVEQRLKLIKKADNIDILSMTATPIPRTLALTIFSNMDISIIKEKPKNRKEIITTIMSTKKYNDLIDSVKNKIENGEKIYWICPLVEETENMDLSNVEKKYTEFCQIFGNETVSFIHGKMKEKEKDEVMEEFSDTNSSKKILIATTVIEVGIDVKDATVIIIEHPERFGLSQLHQLRGRVGRGDKQSYCILLYDSSKISKTTVRRMQIMKNTNDGFIIAEEDLKIRGIGDIVGLKQSGIKDYKIADLDRDFDLLQEASILAENIVNEGKARNYVMLLYLFNYMDYLRSELMN